MTAEHDTSIVETSDASSHRSPLSPISLMRLYFNPKRFFENGERLTKSPEVVIVAWIAGITYAMGRVDTNLMKSEFGAGASTWQEVGRWLSESWIHYWGLVLIVGAINGVILWFLAGWWYRRRLIWSGAGNVVPEHARSVYVYQDLVQSAPIVIVAFVQTLVFSDYMVAWNSDEYWSSIVLLFVFWSCLTSYKAVTTSFSVVIWKARLWFLAIPLSLYIVALGVIGLLLAYLPTGAA